MAQFLCPSCGSKYFLTSKAQPKIVFEVVGEGVVQIIQSDTRDFTEGDIDTHNICCGACSWKGSLGDLVESSRD